jgi:hypothetical protein
MKIDVCDPHCSREPLIFKGVSNVHYGEVGKSYTCMYPCLLFGDCTVGKCVVEMGRCVPCPPSVPEVNNRRSRKIEKKVCEICVSYVYVYVSVCVCGLRIVVSVCACLWEG